MKKLLILYIITVSQICFGQISSSERNLKATHIFCNSNPKDTIESEFYYYHLDNTVERIEKYKKRELFYIVKYIYTPEGKLEKKIDLIPQTTKQYCGENPSRKCMEHLKDQSFNFDSTSNIYYVIWHESPVRYNVENDSIYENSRLTAVLSGNDTLNTFMYDKHNRIKVRYNYNSRTNEIYSISKYKYKDPFIMKYDYSIEHKRRPYLKTELLYNENELLIKKTRTYISYRKGVNYQSIIETFAYQDGKLTTYYINDMRTQSCDFTPCCNSYIKYYIFTDNN